MQDVMFQTFKPYPQLDSDSCRDSALHGLVICTIRRRNTSPELRGMSSVANQGAEGIRVAAARLSVVNDCCLRLLRENRQFR